MEGGKLLLVNGQKVAKVAGRGSSAHRYLPLRRVQGSSVAIGLICETGDRTKIIDTLRQEAFRLSKMVLILVVSIPHHQFRSVRLHLVETHQRVNGSHV